MENFEQRFLLFKKKYEDFIARNQAEIFERFKQQLNSFTNSYQVVKKLVDKINKHEAPDFNVFTIWGVSHLEVVTHTPFLEGLLSPEGSHGQKALFLNSFLEECATLSPEDISSPGWKVFREKEHVDLRIVNYEIMKAVFIENKVYSDAHSGQLSKYYKIFEDQYECNGKFIYLTIEGDFPSEAGFDESIYPKERMEIKCLSYRHDITKWLFNVLGYVSAPKVRDSLNQYIELINKGDWR